MITAEQGLRLRCRDCGWTGECDVFNAKDIVADHTHYWDERMEEYPNIQHVVEGEVLTVFKEDYI